MASNYNRNSPSSGSRKKPQVRSRTTLSGGRASRRQDYAPSVYSQRDFGKKPAPTLRSTSIGDIYQETRTRRVEKTYRSYVTRIFTIAALVGAVLVVGVLAYNSPLFTITQVRVEGVEHLTAEAMTELAAVPANTTLLRVDETGIRRRLMEEPWVKEVKVRRVFPDTLELAISERSIAAVVEVPIDNAQRMENWAIASDGMWLMPIPAQDSEEAASISPQVFEDAARVLKITGVPYGVVPLVGIRCTDENVNNALAIVDGFTTQLADQVKTVSATGNETTTLILDNGVEIAFGLARDIRTKERICLELMEKYEGLITYINVRTAESPTWRLAE